MDAPHYPPKLLAGCGPPPNPRSHRLSTKLSSFEGRPLAVPVSPCPACVSKDTHILHCLFSDKQCTHLDTHILAEAHQQYQFMPVNLMSAPWHRPL